MRSGGGAGAGSSRPASPWAAWTLAGGLVLVAAAAVRALAWTGAAVTLGPPAGGGDAGRHARPTLVYAFHRADCRTHAWLRERWAALAREGRVRVIGIDLDRPGADLPPPPFGFRVRPDRGRRIERLLLRLGYARTPVALVADPAGRIRLAVAPRRDRAAQRAAEEAVRAALALGR